PLLWRPSSPQLEGSGPCADSAVHALGRGAGHFVDQAATTRGILDRGELVARRPHPLPVDEHQLSCQTSSTRFNGCRLPCHRSTSQSRSWLTDVPTRGVPSS